MPRRPSSVAGFFRDMGADTVELMEVTDGRPNVYGIWEGSSDRWVVLDVHTDTVTVEHCEGDPFDGRIADGRVYGRGAVDTKASLGVMLALLEAARTEGLRPVPNLVVVGSIFEEAAHVIVVNEAAREEFLEKYPSCPPGRISVITNGFDPADFAHVTAEPRFLEGGLLHVTVTGHVETMFDLMPFFEAVRRIVESDAGDRALLRIEFVGTKRQAQDVIAEESQRPAHVEECFVERDGFHQRRHAVEHLVHVATHRRIQLVVAGQEHRMRAQAASCRRGHRRGLASDRQLRQCDRRPDRSEGPHLGGHHRDEGADDAPRPRPLRADERRRLVPGAVRGRHPATDDQPDEAPRGQRQEARRGLRRDLPGRPEHERKRLERGLDLGRPGRHDDDDQYDHDHHDDDHVHDHDQHATDDARRHRGENRDEPAGRAHRERHHRHPETVSMRFMSRLALTACAVLAPALSAQSTGLAASAVITAPYRWMPPM